MEKERADPCRICGHNHEYENGEVCGVCGHMPSGSFQRSFPVLDAFPYEILKGFLYLGSYDAALRSDLLMKTYGISHLLNTVPGCRIQEKYRLTYHYLKQGSSLQFDDGIEILEGCKRLDGRVLVHCMSGKNRSPAIVIAYLMKSKGWGFTQSLQWAKERAPKIQLSSAVRQQLMEYERKVFESSKQIVESTSPSSPFDPIPTILSTINQLGSISISDNPCSTASEGGEQMMDVERTGTGTAGDFSRDEGSDG